MAFARHLSWDKWNLVVLICCNSNMFLWMVKTRGNHSTSVAAQIRPDGDFLQDWTHLSRTPDTRDQGCSYGHRAPSLGGPIFNAVQLSETDGPS